GRALPAPEVRPHRRGRRLDRRPPRARGDHRPAGPCRRGRRPRRNAAPEPVLRAGGRRPGGRRRAARRVGDGRPGRLGIRLPLGRLGSGRVRRLDASRGSPDPPRWRGGGRVGARRSAPGSAPESAGDLERGQPARPGLGRLGDGLQTHAL
ncbi:MAG: hypothetical protein AVDCRST_MAG59-3872, partial [uncultured Thermomicrobiales bacterium]